MSDELVEIARCWHWANADGGVKVLVRKADAEWAGLVIARQDDEVPAEQSMRTCPHCARPVPGSWDACWSCGTLDDGTAFPWGSPEETAPPAPHARGVFERADVIDMIGLALLILSSIFVAFNGWLPAAIFWPPTVLVLLGLGRRRPRADEPHRWRTEGTETEAAVAGGDDEPSDDPYPGDVTARRAWLASVLGFIWFPPLILYAAWLLARLDPKANPLSRSGVWRSRAGVALTALGAVLYASLLLAEVVAVIRPA